jgi:hypothetical protein
MEDIVDDAPIHAELLLDSPPPVSSTGTQIESISPVSCLSGPKTLPLSAQHVLDFLDSMRQSQTLAPSTLRRAASNAIIAFQQSSTTSSELRPDGNFVEEMFDPHFFHSGAAALPSGSTPLKVDEWITCHISACRHCRPGGLLLESCYFSSMARCLSNGWQPPVNPSLIQPLYPSSGNSSSILKFSTSVQKAVQKLADFGAIVPVTISSPNSLTSSTELLRLPGDADLSPLSADRVPIISPASAVLKNSDRSRALALTAITVTDQVSLDAANAVLETKGYQPIKVRPVVNLTQSGVNSAALRKPFSYPSAADAFNLITPHCWLAHSDIASYFPHFPVARESFWLFNFLFTGILYCLVRCAFGFSLCPYYCSTFSAEIKAWLLADGIPSAHILDDWFTVGASESEAHHRLHCIIGYLTRVGFSIAHEKTAIAQRMVHLGFLIDTVSMTLSFDALNAAAFAIELRQCRTTLADGHHLPLSVVQRIAGKLNNYSEVLQAGRVRIRLWYAYAIHGTAFSLSGRSALLVDIDWWLGILDTWSNGDVMAANFPLLSPNMLASDPSAIYHITSDASGPDGYGYFHGYLSDSNPQYASRRWSSAADFDHSLHGELTALHHFMTNLHRQPLPATVKLLLWTTDAQSAALAVNKGSCRNAASLKLLTDVLDICDSYRVQLVALWVPREHNTLADYLSHLATSLNRSSVSGRIADIAASNQLGAAITANEVVEGEPRSICSVPCSLPSEAAGSLASNLCDDSLLSGSVRPPALDPLPSASAPPAANGVYSPSYALALSCRQPPPGKAGPPPPLSRLDSYESQSRSSASPPVGHHLGVGFEQRAAAVTSNHAASRPRRAPPWGRADRWHSSLPSHLVAAEQRLHLAVISR